MGALLVSTCLAEHAVFTRQVDDAADGGGLLSFLSSSTQRIEAHFFSAAEAELCVVDEGDAAPRYGSLEDAMKSHQCRAGVNGGYFGADVARTPLGLVCHGGKVVSTFSTKGFTVSGIVYDTGKSLHIERSVRLSTPISAMREAIQGGPFLVENGRVVSGLEKTKKAIRTFIATDGAGRWCVAVSSSLTLHELAVWLAEKGCMGNFRVRTALNLDGGTSSAFWDQAAGVYRPGFKAVRNYVGVRPRRLSAGGADSSKRPAK